MLESAVVQKPSRKLPSKPALITRLYLQRLERKGVTSVRKLSASQWETINRMELAAAQLAAELEASGLDLSSRLAVSRVTQ